MPEDWKIYQQNRQAAYNRHDEIQRATAPDKLPDLSLDETRSYYQELHSLQDWLLDSPSATNRCDRRLKELRSAVDLKKIEEQSERHHGREMRRSGWILFWAIVGGIGTVVLVLLATATPKQSA
jgi:hypothetical protein